VGTQKKSNEFCLEIWPQQLALLYVHVTLVGMLISLTHVLYSNLKTSFHLVIAGPILTWSIFSSEKSIKSFLTIQTLLKMVGDKEDGI
jgi:hypothetical protein